MFDLVNDVGRYPEFLPWCTGARVEDRSETERVASVKVARGAARGGYHGQAVQRRRRPSPCQPFGTGQISPHPSLSPPYWVLAQPRRLRLD